MGNTVSSVVFGTFGMFLSFSSIFILPTCNQIQALSKLDILTQ
jgi:hypothetical protein